METFLTGDKNLNSIILQDLSDRDLFKIFLEGGGKEVYKHDPFWHDRLKKRYPHFLSFKPENISFKDYYLYLIKAIGEIMKEFLIRQEGTLNIKNEQDLDNLPVKARGLFLGIAAENGYLEIVKYLSRNVPIVYINYSFVGASSEGQLEVVKYLLQNGADINTDNNSALNSASSNGYLDTVKYLVENGANTEGWALSFAALNGHLEVVKYLIEKGVDYHQGNNEALEFARNNKRQEVVKYLESLP